MQKLWITPLQGGRGGVYTDSTDMQQVYITKINKTGNSLCLVIPKPFLKAYDLKRGDQMVFIAATDKLLGIKKLDVEELQKLNLEKN